MTKDFLITLDEDKESLAKEEKVSNDKEMEEVAMAKEIELKIAGTRRETSASGDKTSHAHRVSSDYHFSPTRDMRHVTFLGPGGTWWECRYKTGKR